MNKKHDTFLIQIFIEWRRKILKTLLTYNYYTMLY